MTITAPVWPLTIENRVRAIHFAMEQHGCPQARPEICPVEKQVARTLELHEEWQAAQQRLAVERCVAQASAVQDDPVALAEVYGQAVGAGLPDEVLAVIERMQDTAGGKL